MRAIVHSEEFDFRFEMGISEIFGPEERKGVVQSIANYFTIVRVKAQIDQMIDGMKCLGIDELLKCYPSTMYRLFISQPVPLTSESMFNLFLARLSPEGSNKRENEEQIIVYWNYLLELIECKFMFFE